MAFVSFIYAIYCIKSLLCNSLFCPFFVVPAFGGLLFKKCIDMRERVCYFKSVNDMSILDISREYMSRNDRGGVKYWRRGYRKNIYQ